MDIGKKYIGEKNKVLTNPETVGKFHKVCIAILPVSFVSPDISRILGHV